MNETNLLRRPVPHIQHTKALEDAAIAVCNAKSSTGAAVSLCSNALDVRAVREGLTSVAEWFEDPNFFFENTPNGEMAAVENLILLATLLREHLKAGNVT